MTFEDVKNYAKTHKKEIIFGTILGILGIATVKNSIDNKENSDKTKLAHDRLDNLIDEANDNLVANNRAINDLAFVLGVKNKDWGYITIDKEDGTAILPLSDCFDVNDIYKEEEVNE